MGNYSCYLCKKDTGISMGVFGSTESKIEWCQICESEIDGLLKDLSNVSQNSFPSNKSANLFNRKKADLELQKRCGVEVMMRLDADEKVIDFIRIDNGSLSSNSGLMVLTNKKLFLFTVNTSGLVGTKAMGCKSEYLTEIKNIVNIESERTITGELIKISDKGNSILKNIYTDKIGDLQSLKSKFYKLQGETQVQSIPSQNTDSSIDKLRKLKELLDLGIISESEFSEKKQKLMNEI
jgi:hypothetical protein